MLNILLYFFYKLIKFKILAARKTQQYKYSNYFNRYNYIKNKHNEINEISSDIKVKNEDYWPNDGYTVTLNE